MMTFVLLLCTFPIASFAADVVEAVEVPPDVTDTVPQQSEISSNPDFSQGFTNIGGIMTMYSSTVSGGCSITKKSSTSVVISGYSVCSQSDPAIGVVLTLQAYYDGAWHNMATKSKTQPGTRVDLSATYNVTSGYYYRVSAFHSLASGVSSTSRSNSILVN